MGRKKRLKQVWDEPKMEQRIRNQLVAPVAFSTTAVSKLIFPKQPFLQHFQLNSSGGSPEERRHFPSPCDDDAPASSSSQPAPSSLGPPHPTCASDGTTQSSWSPTWTSSWALGQLLEQEERNAARSPSPLSPTEPSLRGHISVTHEGLL